VSPEVPAFFHLLGNQEIRKTSGRVFPFLMDSWFPHSQVFVVVHE